MITINLLPWRAYQRVQQKKQRWRRRLIISSGCVLIMSVMGYFYAQTLTQKRQHDQLVWSRSHQKITDEKKQRQALQRIQYRGYVQQAHRAWGIVLLPNGQSETVQAGTDVLMPPFHVVRFDEQHMLISYLQATVSLPLLMAQGGG